LWKNLADEPIRRLIDIVASGAGLITLSPLFFLIGVWIKLDSPGTVFYRGLRMGKGGKLFRLYKFRTMGAHADRQGPGITAAGDTRITRVGRFLRRTKLDELPQLINVLKGEMSLVGPRPEDPRYAAGYTEEQKEILRFKPGITSAASLAYRNEEALLTAEDWEQVYRDKILPDKLQIDLEYLRQRSVMKDIRLVFHTLARVLEI